MSRHQRRGIVWAIVAMVVFMVWWGTSSGSATTPPSPRLDILLAVRPVAAGQTVQGKDVELRRVAASAALRDGLTDPQQAVGHVALVALAVGEPIIDAEIAALGRRSDVVDLAIKVDSDAGIPSGQLANVQGDLVLTQPGRPVVTTLVLKNVTVLSASHTPTATVVTLRVPERLVLPAIRAENAGDLRLVVHVGSVQ